MLDALDFLRKARTGKPVRLAGKVVVIGGNVTGLDAARTALRLGATDVTLATKHDATTLPAGSHELAAATEEGVKFEFGDKGDAEKNAAKGATLILAKYPEAAKPSEANKFTGRTTTAGVFEAGDALTGVQSAIHAVAGGKRTALAVDAWLRGTDLGRLEQELATYASLPYMKQLGQADDLGELGQRLAERTPVWLKMGACADEAARAVMPTLPAVKRLASLDQEVESGLTLEAARARSPALPAVRVPQPG